MSALPTGIDAALATALAHYQEGRFAVAALLFASILEHTPDDVDALRLRGLSLVRAGNAEAGLPFLACARALAPQQPLAHLHHGIGLLEAGRPARAAALFRRAAILRADDPAPWTNLAAALVALGEARAARAAARRAIALDPRLAAAHHVLGLAEAAAGNPDGACDAFRAALRCDPGFADAWVNLGLVFAQAGQIATAMQAMHKALALRPDHGAAEANLAAFDLLRGDQEEAMARLRRVLRRDPGCIAAKLNLANALLLDREAEQALALLAGRVPAGREGRHWHAQRAMALLLLGRPAQARAELDAISQPYGDAEILVLWRRIVLAGIANETAQAETMAERMAALAGQEGSALLEHRIIGHFELARFHHQRGRPAYAFEHWQNGHRLLARMQPFSREAHREFVDASIAAYDRARLRDGPHAANVDEAPVFIVGLPRSGTTLTEQILAAHWAVHGAGERPALCRTLQGLAGPADRAEAIHKAAALDPTTLTRAADGFLADLHSLAPAALRIADKMPGNALHLGFLATLLPRARVILCRRDPRDIGLSIFQLRFFGYHPYAHDLADLGFYIAEHERLMAHWRAVLPIPMLEIDLAHWVEDFTGTLARVLEFVGLPRDPACERFHESRRRVRTASAVQVREPINARGLGRFRAYEKQLAPLIAELEAAGVVTAESVT